MPCHPLRRAVGTLHARTNTSPSSFPVPPPTALDVAASAPHTVVLQDVHQLLWRAVVEDDGMQPKRHHALIPPVALKHNHPSQMEMQWGTSENIQRQCRAHRPSMRSERNCGGEEQCMHRRPAPSTPGSWPASSLPTSVSFLSHEHITWQCTPRCCTRQSCPAAHPVVAIATPQTQQSGPVVPTSTSAKQGKRHNRQQAYAWVKHKSQSGNGHAPVPSLPARIHSGTTNTTQTRTRTRTDKRR